MGGALSRGVFRSIPPRPRPFSPLGHYARQAQNIDAERKAIEVRVRAERRAGQLLVKEEPTKDEG